LWSEEYQAHIYKGRPLSLDEFNEVSYRVCVEESDFHGLYEIHPYPKLVKVETGPEAQVSEKVEVVDKNSEEPADTPPEEEKAEEKEPDFRDKFKRRGGKPALTKLA